MGRKHYDPTKKIIMKLFNLFALMVLLLLATQCKERENVLFEMDYHHKISVDPTLSTFRDHCFSFTDQQTNILTNFAAQNTSSTAVNVIRPAEARLSSIFEGLNLIFIQDVEIGFYKDNPCDPSDFQLAFYRENIESTQNGGLDLFPSLLNLHDVLTGNEYNIAIKLNFFASPPEYMDIDLNMTFAVVE